MEAPPAGGDVLNPGNILDIDLFSDETKQN
jgi:hypothetical protein